MQKELFSFVAQVMAGEKGASGAGTYASGFAPGWYPQLIFVTADSFDEAKEKARVKASAEGED